MMISKHVHSKKESIPDTAEKLYAEAGAEALRLRSIAEVAGVNLAAINYHFKSKEKLTRAMLFRRLAPLHTERIALLAHFKREVGSDLSVEHVVAAILLPAIHKMSLNTELSHLRQFYLRCSADPTLAIRVPMEQDFATASKLFDDAFCSVFPVVPCEEVLWRVHIFFNAFAGTVANQNTLLLRQEMMRLPDVTAAAVVSRFAGVLAVSENAAALQRGNIRTIQTINALRAFPELARFAVANLPLLADPESA